MHRRLRHLLVTRTVTVWRERVIAPRVALYVYVYVYVSYVSRTVTGRIWASLGADARQL